jgi:hypothetical protein
VNGYLRTTVFLCSALAARPGAARAETLERPEAGRRPLQFHAAEEDTSATEVEQQSAAPVDEVARVGTIQSGFGTSVGTAFAGFQGAVASSSSQEAQAGLLLGGSPLRRLTLLALFGRDGEGNLSPLLAAHVVFLGDRAHGYALGALTQYKAEGFTELGGEAELGLTGAWQVRALHLDANLIGGFGVEEKDMGEVDVEGKLSLGHDLFSRFRAGAAAQVRERLAGDRRLAGNRNWDALAGPELKAWFGPVLVAASGGATTVGVSDGVGGFANLTIAAATGF